MLIGTKIDLESDRKVPYEEVLQYAANENCLFAETSALQNINVQSTFKKLIEEAYKNKFQYRSGIPEVQNNVIKLKDPEVTEVQPKQSKSCNC